MNILPLVFLPLSAFAADSAPFALDLYRELARQDGNLFYSPYSVQNALAMTAAGAGGKTLTEMLHALRLPANPHAELGKLREQLSPKAKDAPVLAIASRLWGKSGQSYERDFLSLTEKHYGAGLTPLAFATDPEGARQQINGWVETQTRQKIRDLLPSGSVTKDTDLVLTNAIYFKGDWEHAFPENRTQEQDFHPASGGALKKKFMRTEEDLPYWENSDWQALRLPYRGGELAMTVLLPKAGRSLKSLAGKLKPELLTALRNGLMTSKVQVALPKFRLEYERALQGVLPKLGMKLAFTPDADFSGIRKPVNGDPLYISAVIHKAFVEVDEKGTEAAAATGIVMVTASAVVNPPKPKVFTADRPFVFLIEHVPTQSVLFLGRLAQP